ncbi:MAG: hypothetical protein COA90_03115 [Gammaproteobacteria bacterium]|nr:MAG: hypothetical protein COA90_03115 [Gammaproteobacteria bacterium]
MNTLANSSAEPNYITRLALKSAPFNLTVESQFYFKGEQIEQRLNLLYHLVRASDKVACIFANKGMGKSTLLTQLQVSAGDDLRLCRIDATQALTATELTEKCLRAFAIDDSENQQADNLLKNKLRRLKDLNIKSVLLVDDADLLSDDARAKLIDYLSWQEDEDFLLQAVLSSSRKFPELTDLHGRLQRVDLPRLTEQELPVYIMQRLLTAGYQGEAVFNEKILKRFYRETQGCPALINQLAHQQLLGISPQKGLNLSVNIMAILKWFSVGLLIASLVFLLIFQDKINTFFMAIEPELITEKITPLAEEEELVTIDADEDKVTSLDEAERNELTSLVTELSQADTIENTVKAEVEVAEKLEPVLEVDSKPESTVTEKEAIHQQDWIKQQNTTDYTFQLMGSWQHDEVAEFINKYSLSGDVAEFQSMRNGRIWYALIYGVYSNKQLALDASKQWAEPLNTLPSWLRRFDSVQKQIKDKE